jgi:hypothetical protein
VKIAKARAKRKAVHLSVYSASRANDSKPLASCQLKQRMIKNVIIHDDGGEMTFEQIYRVPKGHTLKKVHEKLRAYDDDWTHEEYDAQETDKLLASRAGSQKIAEQAYERAKAYCKADRVLEAIDELHVAHVSSFTRETALNTVYIPLFLAKLYSEAGLFAAAKYYALASSFAALQIHADELRGHIYRGLAEAAANDHANGASLGFFLTLRATVLVASQFSAVGSDEIKEFEWGRLYFYAFVLTFGATFIDESLVDYLRNDFLPAVGLRQLYEEALSETEQFFASHDSYENFAAAAISEGIAPPFADTGSMRKLAWEQLGLKWTIEWTNDYETTAMAEGFVALLQILLTDLRNIELSLFRTEVHVILELHSGDLRIEDIPSNDRVIRKVFLPKQRMAPELILGVASTILKMVSGYPHDKFLNIIGARMRLGLMNKTNPHSPYDVLFREFYPRDDYDKIHSFTSDSSLSIPDALMETAKALSGIAGLHHDYDAGKSHEAIRNRYRNTLKGLTYTLPRLLKEENFRATVASLRKDGWKDWHILSAVFSIRLNFVVNQMVPSTAGPKERLRLPYSPVLTCL